MKLLSCCCCLLFCFRQLKIKDLSFHWSVWAASSLVRSLPPLNSWMNSNYGMLIMFGAQPSSQANTPSHSLYSLIINLLLAGARLFHGATAKREKKANTMNGINWVKLMEWVCVRQMGGKPPITPHKGRPKPAKENQTKFRLASFVFYFLLALFFSLRR